MASSSSSGNDADHGESAPDHTPSVLESAAVGAAGGAVVGGVVAGVATLSEGPALIALGFTALGPAPGSIAASWMSSIALTNGVGISSGSLYAACQSAAMGGAALVGTPIVIGAVVTGVAVGGISYMGYRQFFRKGRRGGSPKGDTPGAPEDPGNPELMSLEDEVLSEQEQDDLDDKPFLPGTAITVV